MVRGAVSQHGDDAGGSGSWEVLEKLLCKSSADKLDLRTTVNGEAPANLFLVALNCQCTVVILESSGAYAKCAQLGAVGCKMEEQWASRSCPSIG